MHLNTIYTQLNIYDFGLLSWLRLRLEADNPCTNNSIRIYTYDKMSSSAPTGMRPKATMFKNK